MNIGKKDVAWSYISLAMVQGINIMLLPIILKFLNSAELGLWYTFTSLYGLAMLIDFGFQTVIARNISYLWSGAKTVKKEGFDETDVKENGIHIGYFIKVLSTVKFIYYVMGIIILTIFMTFGTLYLLQITNGEIDLYEALIAWFFYMLSIVLNVAFSFWNAILKGIGAIKVYNQILVITKVTQLILSILLLVVGYGIIGVSFAYLVSVIVNRLLQSFNYYRFTNETKATRKKIKVKYDKEIFEAFLPNTVKTGILSLSNYLVINFPIILCSYFLSLNVSGQFGLINQIITLILTLSNSYFNTYLSKFNYLRVRKQFDELHKLFTKSMVTNYIFNFIAFALLLVFGNFALNLIGADYTLLPIGLMLIVIVYRFLYNNQILFTTFLTTKNKIPHYKQFLISAIITIVVQVVVLTFVESTLLYLIMPLLIIQLIFNNWYWVYYVIKDARGEKNEKAIINE
ncbi:O-unit flippase-like protein [Staphylococcus warneri]|uniref:O-unit flippase-like protein n=1 Tax=Staphylococcus warneri TaxID=1292 RepID=UPI003CEC7EAE